VELRNALGRAHAEGGSGLGIDLSVVVANGLVEDRLSADQAAALEARAEPPGSPVDAALWLHERALSQHDQLLRLRAELDDSPLRLPFFYGEPDIESVADALEATL